jgi:hypothetical protein
MSGFDNLAVSLGLHHVDRPTPKLSVVVAEERLAREMRITFDIDELTGFFAGFVEPNADAFFAVAGC